MPRAIGQPKRILIVRTDRLGDVILSTPVIKNLRLTYPKAYVAFLCRPYTKELLINNPDLDEVIVYDKYDKDRSFLATMKFALDLRKRAFDLALVLHPTNRAHLITFLAKIPRRVGWNRKLTWLLTDRLPYQKQEGLRHELEYSLDILRSLGINIKTKDICFHLDSKAIERVEQLFKEQALDKNSQFIVIGPSASCPSKRWPQNNFLAVIKLLKEKTNFKFVVITSESEKGFGEKIAKEGGIVDLRGKLNILEIGALLKRAALFISNDSGPVHIAASFNTPVISIFGRKDSGLSPQRWKPLGVKSSYIHKDAGCSICLAHNCQKSFLCLDKITAQEVAEKALLILNEN